MIEIDSIASASMESFWTHHQNGDLDDAISKFRELELSTVAVDFSLNPDSYYFPNRRNDTFVKPEGISNDLIPIIALESGKTYHLHTPYLHSLQRAGLSNSTPLVDQVVNSFSDFSDEISSSGGSPGTASVHNRLVPIGTSTWVDSSPAIIFNFDRRREQINQVCGSVALHELVHVAQTLSDPIRGIGDGLQKELEAYAVQARLVYSDIVPYTIATAMAGEVDIFRKKYLGENIFEPTDEFRTMFAEEPILNKVYKSLF